MQQLIPSVSIFPTATDRHTIFTHRRLASIIQAEEEKFLRVSAPDSNPFRLAYRMLVQQAKIRENIPDCETVSLEANQAGMPGCQRTYTNR